MPNIQIRFATKKDASKIAKFNVFFAKATQGRKILLPVTEAGVKYVFETFNNGLYLVAEAENEIVGVALVMKEWSDWSNGFFYSIQDIFILNAEKEDEINTLLFEKIKEIANLDKDVCGLRIYLHESDLSRKSHYENIGFKKTKYQIYEVLNESL